MTVKKGKLLVAAALAFLGLTLCAGYSLAGSDKTLSIQASCPDITISTPFNISLKITNDHDSATIKFDRVMITYIKPDMTFVGPVEGIISPATLAPGQSRNRTVSFTVTSGTSGTIIPIMVNLFEGSLSTDPSSFRGVVLVGGKVL